MTYRYRVGFCPDKKPPPIPTADLIRPWLLRALMHSLLFLFPLAALMVGWSHNWLCIPLSLLLGAASNPFFNPESSEIADADSEAL